jgi:tetratricopeptide (TPR) repeat protein
LARLLLAMGQNYEAAAESSRAIAYLDRYIALKRESDASVKSSAGLAYARICLANAHAYRGEFQRAECDLRAGRAILAEREQAMQGCVLARTAMLHGYRGQWERCVENAAAARNLVERVGGGFESALSATLATATVFENHARFVLDHSPVALSRMRWSVDWLEAHGPRTFGSLCCAYLAEALCEAHQPELAQEYAQRALQKVEHGDVLGETFAYHALARAAHAQGRPHAVTKAALDRALASARAHDCPREVTLTRLVAAELAPGDERGVAREIAAQARHEFERMGMRWHAARAARLARA